MLTGDLTLHDAMAPVIEARAGGYGLAVGVRSAPGAEWLPAAELARDGGPLDELVAALALGAGLDHPPLGAEWVLEHLAWQGASLAAAAMMSGGWVPDLRPENVLVHVRDGAIAGIALRGGEVRRPCGDAALAQAGHDALIAHLAPLVAAISSRRLRAPRALWRAAGDRVGQAFLWCAQAFSDPERAHRLATLMIAPPSPMHVPLLTAQAEDGSTLHVRASCCLYHRVPGAEPCAGCPLRRKRVAARQGSGDTTPTARAGRG